MNKGMLTVGIIIFALMALLLVNVISNYSTGGELDYYLVKETTEAAMHDAIDLAFYRRNAIIRLDREKFVESFLRRFADSVDNTREYDVSFYAINEIPPKVSIKVNSLTVLNFDDTAANISTSIDSIIEENNIGDPLSEVELKDEDSNIGRVKEKKTYYEDGK